MKKRDGAARTTRVRAFDARQTKRDPWTDGRTYYVRLTGVGGEKKKKKIHAAVTRSRDRAQLLLSRRECLPSPLILG
jgi:hypothetical protein